MERYLSRKKSSMRMRSAAALLRALNPKRKKAAVTIRREVSLMPLPEIAKKPLPRQKSKKKGRFEAG